MTTNLIPKMLRYVQVSSVLGKRALDRLAEKQAADKRAADQIPALLDKMVQAGTITAQQKQAAAQMLGDHGSALQLLGNAVTKIAELSTAAGQRKAASDLGQGVEDPEKTGSASGKPEDWSLTSPLVGVRTSEKKASDHALLRGLGLES